MIHKYKDPNDKHIIRMNEIIKNNQIQEDSKVETYFALGKAYDDLMLFDKAFEMFDKGNLLNKKRSNYSKEITEKHFFIIAKCADSLKKKNMILKRI